MSHRPIIDAGPGLNFLSINQERLLIGALGPLSAPETVSKELLSKSRRDPRFRAAAAVWRKMTPRWIEILSDDVTPELAAVVHRITQQPMQERLKEPGDLGETMVIAHAVVAAEAGNNVTVLIDDGEGARTATLEINRLNTLRATGQPLGSITLVNTVTVLQLAIIRKLIPDKAALRTIYQRMQAIDDGLPPIGSTDLLSPTLWQ
jgi:hypothetical protein